MTTVLDTWWWNIPQRLTKVTDQFIFYQIYGVFRIWGEVETNSKFKQQNNVLEINSGQMKLKIGSTWACKMAKDQNNFGKLESSSLSSASELQQSALDHL